MLPKKFSALFGFSGSSYSPTRTLVRASITQAFSKYVHILRISNVTCAINGTRALRSLQQSHGPVIIPVMLIGFYYVFINITNFSSHVTTSNQKSTFGAAQTAIDVNNVHKKVALHCLPMTTDKTTIQKQ